MTEAVARAQLVRLLDWADQRRLRDLGIYLDRALVAFDATVGDPGASIAFSDLPA